MNICIPTLNAVDEFWKCVESIKNSSVSTKIYVVDNGGFVNQTVEDMVVHKPIANLGVAGSWNYFLDHTHDVRIITNDDIVFDKFAIERMQEFHYKIKDYSLNLITTENIGTPFSCYLISDATVEKVGKFDEWISPKYAYFEDDDYSRRMSLLEIGISRAAGAIVEHAGSSTLRHFDKIRIKEHHDKFRLARDHYKKKWGGGPREEQFRTPFNR